MRVARQDRVTRLTVSCEVAGSRVTCLFFGQIERHRNPTLPAIDDWLPTLPRHHFTLGGLKKPGDGGCTSLYGELVL